jgi:hypothetical protein
MDPHAPPPPWFFLALFPMLAVSAGIVIRSIGTAIARVRQGRAPAALMPTPAAASLPDPQVARLQAEIDDLRTQLERMSAAESFYAQLNAPAGAERG